MPLTSSWPALAAARDHGPATRLPFLVDGALVGSVARGHLGALAAYPQALDLRPDAVHLLAARPERDAVLASINRALRDAGLVVAWRDELYAIVERQGAPAYAQIERAASRFWGTLTFGAHCNGYVADAAGRPTHLWIARRSFSKPTDPGVLDNLVGGGVPAHQTPRETLVREGWEEAGLTPEQMQAAQPGRVIHLRRDIPEGLQQEWLYVFDLALPAGLQPVNQDGEVAELHRMPVPEALARAAAGEMTVDAALATLDFALRHHLLPPAEQAALAARFEPLLADTASTAFQAI